MFIAIAWFAKAGATSAKKYCYRGQLRPDFDVVWTLFPGFLGQGEKSIFFKGPRKE